MLSPSIRGKKLTEFNRLALQRSIQYTVHIKMFGTNGHTASRKMKSHAFCVPHDGASTLADNLVLNNKCLENFTMTFIGESKIFELMKSTNKITQHTVNAELSYQLLNYFKSSGHPLYANIDLPEYELFSQEITNLSNQALGNIIINCDAVTQIMESRMENQENGYSGLLESNCGSTPNKDAINGIKKMLKESKNVSKKDNENEETDKLQSKPISISIKKDILNEYTNNNIIFGGTFPFEFPLGVPDKFSKGHFPMHVFHRLLKSHTNEFESSHNFVFLSFSQVQRHSVSRAVSYSSKSSITHMAELANVLKHEDFDKKLSISVKDPSGK